MLAKTESSVQVDALAAARSSRSARPPRCPRIVVHCRGRIDNCSYVGAEDLLASLAGVRVATSVVSTETSPASPVQFSSVRARTIERRSTQSTSTSRHRGLAKRRATPRRRFLRDRCIHPSQVDVVRALSTDDDEIAWPRAHRAAPTRVVSFVTRSNDRRAVVTPRREDSHERRTSRRLESPVRAAGFSDADCVCMLVTVQTAVRSATLR